MGLTHRQSPTGLSSKSSCTHWNNSWAFWVAVEHAGEEEATAEGAKKEKTHYDVELF